LSPGVITRVSGSAADFHARELPDVVSVWQIDVEHPAIVLGSRQTEDVLDVVACRERQVEIARRRSGGGVVLLMPGATEWIDVVVPAADPRWEDDVRRSMVRIGERWVDALRGVVDGELTVHRGPQVRTAWSELVCFAGVAPGEVLLDGVKLIGLSQRRTRHGSRFQCAVNRRFDADLLIELLADPVEAALPPVATLPPTARDIAERFVEAFSTL
jgi:lipoate-protein ligase A